jgi:hypothetical protein
MKPNAHAAAVIVLAALLGLSGCLGAFDDAPTAPTQPTGDETIDVEMSGNATGTPFLTVYFFNETPEDVTLEYANGTSRRVAVTGEQGVEQRAVPDGLRRVEVGQGVVHGIHFEGQPSYQVQARDLPKIGTVVYAIYDRRGGRVVGWGVARCDQHVSQLSLRVEDGNATVAGIACAN